jgi:phosphatidylserine/phosphatidylglycerophosphate/cardiolipin synthase-like enzyme
MSLDVASEIGERTSVFITTALNTGVRYYHWHCRGLGNDVHLVMSSHALRSSLPHFLRAWRALNPPVNRTA